MELWFCKYEGYSERADDWFQRVKDAEEHDFARERTIAILIYR